MIGLQFVVMTLIRERPNIRPEAGAAYGTPTIMHFSAVLLLSALIRAPWPTILPAASLCGTLGFCGVVYAILVIWRIRTQSAYQPEFEDWLFHAVFPLAAYTILAGSAIMALQRTADALFGVGATALLLLFAGIHNAWDAVTYHIYVKSQESNTKEL